MVQCVAGCELYPNRTSRAFAYVGYNGQDFLSYDVDLGKWILYEDTDLARYVQATLQNYTAFSELVQVLFNDTCVDDMELLLQYGKAALARRGETAPTQTQPTPKAPTTGTELCPRWGSL